MRYQHPRKTPFTPMYYWIEVRNYESLIEERNIWENTAVYWHHRHAELKEQFFATPMNVYWDSFREKFPDAFVSYRKINDDIIELKAENDRLRNALSSLYESCMRAGFEGDLSELISGEILDAVQQILNEVTK